jgi:cyclic pyranopterin monophosphate synthase
MADSFTHFDDQGASRMVDISAKTITARMARASGCIHMQPRTLAMIQAGEHAKGNVLEVARLAGIMGAKRTADLIPLCHSLPLESVAINFTFEGDDRLHVEAIAQTTSKTGVEMEALVAVNVALLTVYDMCKAVDKGMSIHAIQLEEKQGGRSGHYLRQK